MLVLAMSLPIYVTLTEFGNSLILSFFHLSNENDIFFMVLLKQEKTGNRPSIVHSTEVEETFSLCLCHCFIYSRPLSFIMGVM